MAEARWQGRVAIAGSGKMGLDLGLFWLSRGAQVCWYSRSRERLDGLRPLVERGIRRLNLVSPGDDPGPRATLACLDELADSESFDLVIETTVEERAAKQAVARALAPVCGPRTLRLSNSSSILPEEIGPAWMGAHFFHPVGLNPLVELVQPGQWLALGRPEELLASAQALLSGLGFYCLVQDSARAFAVNRLLLPLQALALACLKEGHAPAAIDAASAASPLPLAVLSAMDGIGLTVIRNALDHYRERWPQSFESLPGGETAADLIGAFDLLLAMGKAGARNRDGLCCGQALPWPTRFADTPEQRAELAGRFRAAALAGFDQAMARGDLDRGELALALQTIWGGTLP